MRFLSEQSLREFLRRVLTEDAYNSGVFSSERLYRSVIDYTGGSLAKIGVSPDTAREVALDDLRVAFGEMGYDLYTGLQNAIFENDRREAESIVREILEGDFIGPRGPLKDLHVRSLDDILLPGDVDELVNLIVSDLFDGDEKITLY